MQQINLNENTAEDNISDDILVKSANGDIATTSKEGLIVGITLEKVLDNGNDAENTITLNDETYSIRYEGRGQDYNDGEGHGVIHRYADLTALVQYTWPSKTEDDIVAMLTDIDYVNPNSFTGTDIEKIQSAIAYASEVGKPVLISYNETREDFIWLIDEAILLPSNSFIKVRDTKIKLSDTCRDNVFRTENSGLGISNPESNVLNNITILGEGEAILEGADNPRATGDAAKTLTLDSSTNVSGFSYGSDTGASGESQKGDWRNYGILMAYATNIRVQGLTLSNMHCWASSYERCDKVLIRDIKIYNDFYRDIAGNPAMIVRNTDGIDVRMGCHNFFIENIHSVSGDDIVAMTIVNNGTHGAGELESFMVSSEIYGGDSDDIYNIYVKNISGRTYANFTRVLNTLGTKIYNVSIDGLTDTSANETLDSTIGGAMVLFGSRSSAYGGPTPLGTCYNITVNNVKSTNYPYCINIQGSLSESMLSNIYKATTGTTNNSVIYTHPSSQGTRNVLFSNIYDQYNDVTELVTIRDNALGTATGVVNNASDALAIYKSGTLGKLKILDGTASDDAVTKSQLDTKQAILVSGTNIKTVGGTSILGSGDIPISGTGTVTSVSVTTANGVSGSVATSTTTPAITLTLGAITPTSVAATGNVTGANLSGTNTGDLTGTGIPLYAGSTTPTWITGAASSIVRADGSIITRNLLVQGAASTTMSPDNTAISTGDTFQVIANKSQGQINALTPIANDTTTAFTKATLNSTYASATVGFRVICKNVGSGMIYTKASGTDWLSSTAVLMT